jgi:hypothetical protein
MLQAVRRRGAVPKPSEIPVDLEPKKDFKKGRRKQASPPRTMLQIVGCVVLISIVMYQWVLTPMMNKLLGDGLSSEGGVTGKWLDGRRFRLYKQQQLEASTASSSHLHFPDVALRANRKSIPGYSRFLEKFLRRHSLLNGEKISLSSRNATEYASRNDWVEPAEMILYIDAGMESYASDRGKERNSTCSPGWACQRCLSSPFRGSFEKCRTSCPPCYLSTFCSDIRPFPPRISVQSSAPSNTQGIPFVLHQAWVEPIRTLYNPELARLQTAWKCSGAQYHFYTPETARRYVTKHFPAAVSETYQGLEPAESQLSFFRLLVLFREGGVFANGTVD